MVAMLRAVRGSGIRLDRGRLLRGRDRCRRRQKPERIDIAVRFAGLADTQVNVRLRRITGRTDDVSLAHRQPSRHGNGTEPLERDGVTLGRADRDRLPAGGHGAREGDCAGGRRNHRRRGRGADVDSAVLAAGIWVVTKDERSNHRPVDGPGPGERGLHADLERDEDRKQQGKASHRYSSSLSSL